MGCAYCRGVVSAQAMPPPEPEQRVELDEGSIDPGMNEGTKFRNVMPKSYRMLEAQLGGGGAQSALQQKRQQPPPAAAAPPPAPAAQPAEG